MYKFSFLVLLTTFALNAAHKTSNIKSQADQDALRVVAVNSPYNRALETTKIQNLPNLSGKARALAHRNAIRNASAK